MINCCICEKEFNNYKALSCHLKLTHKEISKQEYYDTYLKKDKEDECVICNNKTKFRSIVQGYNKTCCQRCNQLQPEIRLKIRNTFNEKYGGHPLQNNIIKEKIKNTNVTKYGVSNVAMLLINKEKIKNTNLNKPGVESHMKLDEVKQKQKSTCLNKHGVDNVSKSTNIQEQKRINYYNRLLQSKKMAETVVPLFTLEEYVGTKRENEYTFKCVKCDSIFIDHLNNGRIPRCLNCYPHLNGTSKYESEILDFLKSLNISNIQTNIKTIILPYELDIYLPDYNLAIEFDGLYWHGESQGKDKNYHINKTNLCKEKNITLFHIFEDEWINKSHVVKSMILNKLGLITNKVFARKCIIKEIKHNESKQFFDINHIQGNVQSKYNLGLFYNDELVSLLSIGASRFNKNYTYEMHRFCSKINTSVIGGFSKLLKYFKEHYHGNIITYADLRYGTGDVYLNNGFTYLHTSKPNYYYFKLPVLKRDSRNKFQKHKLINLLEYFDENLSEVENMKLNGYDRIWDCGNNVFGLNL